ncbi:MAG: hypothetical protein HY040_24225 [Planctomycetes bacterium]|nr:hypothetical protein [Planctomycetota bacterium]
MDLVIDAQGMIRCLYGEAIALHRLGEMSIQRASHVEPDTIGRWWADLKPVDGPILGPFLQRSQALDAESAWLETNWLVSQSPALQQEQTWQRS